MMKHKQERKLPRDTTENCKNCKLSDSIILNSRKAIVKYYMVIVHILDLKRETLIHQRATIINNVNKKDLHHTTSNTKPAEKRTLSFCGWFCKLQGLRKFLDFVVGHTTALLAGIWVILTLPYANSHYGCALFRHKVSGGICLFAFKSRYAFLQREIL